MKGRQRGGALLLLAMAALALAAVPVLMMQLAVVREFALEGEALLGARAALAADSALAWFLRDGWRGCQGRLGAELPDLGMAVPAGLFAGSPELTQEADLRVRFLGPSALATDVDAWQVTVRARVRVPAGPAYQQTREAWLCVPRTEAGGPVLRAWRIVR